MSLFVYFVSGVREEKFFFDLFMVSDWGFVNWIEIDRLIGDEIFLFIDVWKSI